MKKLAALLLALVMTLGLTACGSNGSTDTPKTDDPTPGVSEPNKRDETSDNGISASTQEFIDAINVENAEEKGVCGLDLTWYYLDNVLVIRGTGEMNDYATDTFETYAPWAELKDQIHMIIVDEGATKIGTGAFIGLEQLNRVILPNTVHTVGESAFRVCSNLKEVVWSNNLTQIEAKAFAGCGLEAVCLPNSLTTIGFSAFSACPLTDIVFPASITQINDDGLLHSTQVKTIVFEGDAPELLSNGGTVWLMGLDPRTTTIFYSGSGFENYIEYWPDYDWVKE